MTEQQYKTIIKDIPTNMVEKVIANLEADIGAKVEKKKQDNGLWTVIATFK